MAQVKTIGEAVRNMSVLMANMYYHLTKAVIEDFGDEAKESFKRAIIEFGHERGRNMQKCFGRWVAADVRKSGQSFTISPSRKVGICIAAMRMI